VPLEKDQNFAIMGEGGGNFHGVVKLDAVCCLSVWFLEVQNKEFPPETETVFCRNKKWRE
jgi:hypothetical protein